MMLFIEINGLPHCPRNRSHQATVIKGGKGRAVATIIRTEAAHAYEDALKHHLEKYRKVCDKFVESWDPATQHLVAIWEFHSPDVLTKKGAYSQNGTDLDAHKVLQDTIMGFIGIDDAYIARDTRTKIQGEYAIKLDLRIQENDRSDLL